MWTSFHGIHVAQSGCCSKVHLVLTRSHLPAWPAGEMLQKRNCICKTVSQSMLPVFAVTSAATSLLHLLLKALWECRTTTWIGYVIGTVQARANYSAMVSGSSMLELRKMLRLEFRVQCGIDWDAVKGGQYRLSGHRIRVSKWFFLSICTVPFENELEGLSILV